MNKKKLVICGDSFSVGIGCHDLHNEPYGSLLSKELNLELVNLAKGSSTNLSIFLQVKYAVENIKDIEYLFVGTTCYHRTEWFPEKSNPYIPLDNTNVNYHQYPPYGYMTYPYILEHPMKNDNRYKGEMFTENYNGIIDYVDNILDKNNGVNNSGYFTKFKNEDNKKMRLLKEYYLYFFDARIQRQNDMGQIVMSHNLLRNKNIKHYILTNDVNDLSSYIDKNNMININWSNLSISYPDDLKTLHTSSEGHKVVYETILKKMSNNII